MESGGREAWQEVGADTCVEGFALDLADAFVFGDEEVEVLGWMRDGADLVGGVDEVTVWSINILLRRGKEGKWVEVRKSRVDVPQLFKICWELGVFW